MTSPFSRGRRLSVRRMLSAAIFVAWFSIATQAATSITGGISGNVRNLTRDLPAIGDEVILLRLDNGLRRETQAKTNAQGTFSLPVKDPAKQYLVRVLHQGVTYDRRASAGDTLSIQVFDAAYHVPAIAATLEILRADAAGNSLHVSDLYELKNDSSPPLTQAGDRSFEVYLPENAKLGTVLAAGPEKMGVLISADPVPGEPGHFTVNFPLRPGETKFAFNYDLPYRGTAAFRTRRAYPLQQLAVMIPPSMKFSSGSSAFELLSTGRSDYQVQTITRLNAGDGPSFELSGAGTLPPLGNQASLFAPSQRSSAVSVPIVRAPELAAKPAPVRVDLLSNQSRSLSQSLLPDALTALLLAVCIFLVWRARKPQRTSVVKKRWPRSSSAPLKNKS